MKSEEHDHNLEKIAQDAAEEVKEAKTKCDEAANELHTQSSPKGSSQIIITAVHCKGNKGHI